MFIRKNLSFKGIMIFTGGHIVWLTIWAGLATFFFTNFIWFSIPWLPVSLVGTAVAFYIGFKNSQSYDRLWEARKIWGAIVNSSRSWGRMVKAYITDQFADEEIPEPELYAIRKRLIYRHIGWLYTLRNQLLEPTPWEHINQGFLVGRTTRRRMEIFGVGLVKDGVTESMLKKYLPNGEYERLINYKNSATQIIDEQSLDLMKLRRSNIIEDFRHMNLQRILNEFYEHQGKCERIKKFPFPRQYGGMSMVFVGIFISG